MNARLPVTCYESYKNRMVDLQCSVFLNPQVLLLETLIPNFILDSYVLYCLILIFVSPIVFLELNI